MVELQSRGPVIRAPQDGLQPRECKTLRPRIVVPIRRLSDGLILLRQISLRTVAPTPSAATAEARRIRVVAAVAELRTLAEEVAVVVSPVEVVAAVLTAAVEAVATEAQP